IGVVLLGHSPDHLASSSNSWIPRVQDPRSGPGFLAPTITHLVWSLGMLFMLPDALSLGAALFG
ncbi:hypothetical protein, partial [Actinomyces radicidentis]|uniref:hypothetical protein n=1 Tax=Actinomyces radicidentis TaxID=111015 RepID=UPI0026DFF0F7